MEVSWARERHYQGRIVVYIAWERGVHEEARYRWIRERCVYVHEYNEGIHM